VQVLVSGAEDLARTACSTFPEQRRVNVAANLLRLYNARKPVQHLLSVDGAKIALLESLWKMLLGLE